MATSGIYTFALNKNQIITRAFQLINVYGLSDTVENDDLLFASDILNGMIKVWETQGIHLWKRRQATVFPALLSHSYDLGSVSGAEHVTNTYVNTEVTTAALSGATTLVVDSVTGMSTSDNIGIELDDGTRQWTTISSIASTTITLASALTDDVAVDNTVVTYTSKINRPLRILRATTIDLKNSNAEVTMQKISYDEYFNFPNKSLVGRPTNFYYDRLIENAIPHTGKLYIFPEPQDVNILITFTYLDSIQDFNASSDNQDFPQEWAYPLIFNLACELAYSYGKFTELQVLQPKATELKMAMDDFDSDDESMVLGVDRLYHGT